MSILPAVAHARTPSLELHGVTPPADGTTKPASPPPAQGSGNPAGAIALGGMLLASIVFLVADGKPGATAMKVAGGAGIVGGVITTGAGAWMLTHPAKTGINSKGINKTAHPFAGAMGMALGIVGTIGGVMLLRH